MEDKSNKEALAGHPATSLVLTTCATLAAAPAGAAVGAVTLPLALTLLPILLNSYANERYQERVATEIRYLNDTLASHEQAIRDLSDAQFKLINEVIVTAHQNLEQDKVIFLRAVVKAALVDKSLTHEQATIFARVMRDISASELAFLVRYFSFNAVIFDHPEIGVGNLEELVKLEWERLEDTTDNRLLISGLLSLGLMKHTGTMSDSYEFTPIVAKLLTLIQSH